MKSNYYIINEEAKLIKTENTVYVVNKKRRKSLPINKIEAVYAENDVSPSSQVIRLFGEKGIPIHFFNRHGGYIGSFLPKKKLLSGDLVVKQSEHYLDEDKRLYLAKKFVFGSVKNMVRNIERREAEIHKERILDVLKGLDKAKKITDVMNVEARCRDIYYSFLDISMPDEFKIIKRERRPPKNRGNALLSFGNALLYATVIGEIYHTALSPEISYLHEPFERRFSLALDIADIFKPLLVDRVILTIVNKKMLKPGDFVSDLNYALLSERGKTVFSGEFEKKLQKTIKHRGINRNVSYRRLIRLELYKLQKHLLGTEKYEPFVIWW